MQQIAVPWSDPRSRFTALFEALVIDWLREGNVLAISRRLQLSWAQVAGIQRRAVERGVARREQAPPTEIGVDETSFQKRHEYVTVVHDVEREVVVHVADGRKQEALEAYFEALGPEACAALERIAMDMWAVHRGDARPGSGCGSEDRLRQVPHRQAPGGCGRSGATPGESRAGLAGQRSAEGRKYLWLQNPDPMSGSHWREFAPLRDSRLKVARAWTIKKAAMLPWGYVRRGWAERLWTKWYAWAIRSRLEPIKRVARMIKKHWEGVMNGATTSVTNARAKAIHSRIQWLKQMACGFRNRENFRNAIYFHLGSLDLYPETLKSAHTKA